MKEIPHCELSKEHYHLIRTDGSYRNFLMLEEMKLENEPSWNQELELLEEVAPVTKGIAELSAIKQIENLKGFQVWITGKYIELLREIKGDTNMEEEQIKKRGIPSSYLYSKIIDTDEKTSSPASSEATGDGSRHATSPQHPATSQQDNTDNIRNEGNTRNTPQQGGDIG